MNTRPLKRAYPEAKILAPVVVTGLTGPIPPRIIDASRRESAQPNPAIQWYPAIPMNNATADRKPPLKYARPSVS